MYVVGSTPNHILLNICVRLREVIELGMSTLLTCGGWDRDEIIIYESISHSLNIKPQYIAIFKKSYFRLDYVHNIYQLTWTQ